MAGIKVYHVEDYKIMRDGIRAIKTVMTGQTYICTETARRLKNLNKFLSGMENNLRSKDEVFSQREREVLNHLSKEIADALFITERTLGHRVSPFKHTNCVRILFDVLE